MATEVYSYRPDNEIITEEKSEKNRSGKTTITSVSVSDEFKAIVDKYNLSPTDVFRRGVAVTLADMGISPYNTVMNEERIKAIKSKLQIDSFETLIKELDDLTNNLKKIVYEIKI